VEGPTCQSVDPDVMGTGGPGPARNSCSYRDGCSSCPVSHRWTGHACQVTCGTRFVHATSATT